LEGRLTNNRIIWYGYVKKKINAERNSRKVVDMEVEVKCLRGKPQTR
jgi:hypothetical protein